MEKTLCIIKPDGVSKGITGKIVSRIENANLIIVAMKIVRMTKLQAEGFYSVHKNTPFFDSLTTFMSSGPAIAMVLKGKKAIHKYRDIMGATDHKVAAEGTIRKDFATDIEKNVVHGSDSKESAMFEISYFFNSFEIIG